MTGAAGQGHRRPAAAPDDLCFSYHRSVAPMVWMLVSIGAVELVVTHVLLSFWNRGAALLLSLATLAALGWVIRGLLSMKHRPVVLTDRQLVMRVGTIRSVTVPLESIAGLRPTWDAAGLKQRSVLNLALVAYPNVVVDLTGPLPGRRGIRTIAHRLDEPAAFVAALERLRAPA